MFNKKCLSKETGKHESDTLKNRRYANGSCLGGNAMLKIHLDFV